jgi:hypothetical protein
MFTRSRLIVTLYVYRLPCSFASDRVNNCFEMHSTHSYSTMQDVRTREVYETCVFIGYYAACSDNSLPKFRENLLVTRT